MSSSRHHVSFTSDPKRDRNAVLHHVTTSCHLYLRGLVQRAQAILLSFEVGKTGKRFQRWWRFRGGANWIACFWNIKNCIGDFVHRCRNLQRPNHRAQPKKRWRFQRRYQQCWFLSFKVVYALHRWSFTLDCFRFCFCFASICYLSTQHIFKRQELDSYQLSTILGRGCSRVLQTHGVAWKIYFGISRALW